MSYLEECPRHILKVFNRVSISKKDIQPFLLYGEQSVNVEIYVSDLDDPDYKSNSPRRLEDLEGNIKFQ